MEEELNEHELEERLHAMLHHVDGTQNILINSQQQNKDALQLIENRPRSTIHRYWHTENETNHNPYKKVNWARYNQHPTPTPPARPAPPAVQATPTPVRDQVTIPTTPKITDEAAPKEEKSPPKPPSPVDLTLFQSPVPQNVNKVIEFLDHEEDRAVVLESSDDDEVVEVALPPKPTITIDSSDEEELCVVNPNQDQKPSDKSDPKSNSGDRAVSASPVPSVVSSVSDEFIRGDCIALNISSRHPDKHSFDFSLHGSDLLGQNTITPSKKKKRKKNKETATSNPIIATAEKSNNGDVCFATPKSKAKNKKQKNKLFNEKTLPNPFAHDSDNNVFGATNRSKSYTVTDRSLPNPDVYESDSNQSEIVKENTDQSKDKNVIEAYSSDSSDIPTTMSTKKPTSMPDSSAETVDLTGDAYVTLDETGFEESIVMANVIGFTESTDYGENDSPSRRGDISKYVSSKVPSILNEDLDFDNLKGKEKVCKKRRYSLTTLRAEMDKFYNASWGGEDFDHIQILKNMPRDKSLWAIDPKDRMQSFAQRKTKCGYCNRAGHRSDTCRQRPPVCYMCGSQGHFEPRCPDKICVNCGSPNRMYSSMCGACAGWGRVQCGECGRAGHPASHCPDTWRRYHNTTSLEEDPECTMLKRPQHQYCSGCARRGHLVHACRATLPFSALPINPPHVANYTQLYGPPRNPRTPRQGSNSFSEDTNRNKNNNNNNKRFSKSPTVHETHVPKKPHLSTVDDATKTPVVAQKNTPKVDNNKNKRKSSESTAPQPPAENAPDLIPIGSSNSNHDNKGRVIQDNEVSDTSDAIFASRIFVTDDVITKLKSKEGEDWLQATSATHHVTVAHTDITSFLNIRGKHADQELFQSALREWVRSDTDQTNHNNTTNEEDKEEDSNAVQNIPKNRNNLLRQINNALDLLKFDYGDPMRLYKELLYSQNQHSKMLKQKDISHKKLTNSRTHINDVLKKLNIILLGQAGLANGSDHIHELITHQKKLMRSQTKNITVELRKEIGQHYHTVFSATARGDYASLMKKYYVANRRAKVAKKKKKRPSAGPVLSSDNPSIPPQGNVTAANKPAPNKLAAGNKTQEKENRKDPNQPNYLPKLMFYHKRLNDIKGASQITKQEIMRLQRRVHTFISMLYRGTNINSKNVKKVKKLNSQVENFLAQTENTRDDVL